LSKKRKTRINRTIRLTGGEILRKTSRVQRSQSRSTEPAVHGVAFTEPVA